MTAVNFEVVINH